jgi:hypothetical protein
MPIALTATGLGLGTPKSRNRGDLPTRPALPEFTPLALSIGNDQAGFYLGEAAIQTLMTSVESGARAHASYDSQPRICGIESREGKKQSGVA